MGALLAVATAPVVAAGTNESLASPVALILIGAGAFALPIIARRLRIPAIVPEILFGVAVGPEVLDLVGDMADLEAIELLAELGLLLLLFLAGFEIDFDQLERRGFVRIATGLSIFGLTLIAAFAGSGLLGVRTGNQRAFVTLLISAASAGIVVRALRSTRRLGTALGQLTLITAVLAEFLSLTGIVVLGVWVERGFGLGLLSVPALFLVLAAMLLLIRRAAWWFPERFEHLFSSDDPDELGIRASLALLFVFVGISVAFGIEGILGAFLAGTMFAFIFRDTGPLEDRLRGFAFGFFIPIFFINVGIGFPIRDLQEPEFLGPALGLVAVAVVVKVLPALFLMVRGFSLRKSLAAGVLLAGQLSVIIALAELGLDLGLLPEKFEAGAILLVAITAALSPAIFRVMAPPLPAKEPATGR